MNIGIEPLIYGFIFGGGVALVEGIYLVTFGKSISLNSRVNRRLEMLEKGGQRQQVLEQLRKEMQQHLSSQKIPLYSLLAEKAQKASKQCAKTRAEKGAEKTQKMRRKDTHSLLK